MQLHWHVILKGLDCEELYDLSFWQKNVDVQSQMSTRLDNHWFHNQTSKEKKDPLKLREQLAETYSQILAFDVKNPK